MTREIQNGGFLLSISSLNTGGYFLIQWTSIEFFHEDSKLQLQHIFEGQAFWGTPHWVRKSILGQYIATFGWHNGSGKAHWVTKMVHRVNTMGQHIWLAQWVRQAHWFSTLPHWVLGRHYGWAQCVRQSILGQYTAIWCQHIGSQKVPWASTLQHSVSTLGQYIATWGSAHCTVRCCKGNRFESNWC